MRKSREILRLFFSIIFLMGGVANLLILMLNPDLYSTFADLSLLESYRIAWLSVVLPNLNIFVLAVVVFEFLLSTLIASKKGAVRTGLILAAIFMLFLVPFWWDGGAIINILFVIILLWLLRFKYPLSLAQRLFGDEKG